MPDSITISAYAKLNYTLDVLSLRPDGYHNLASVMQTISLADVLRIERCERPGVEFHCDAADVPADESNLSVRAAHAALRTADRREGLCIRLEKRIPIMAGLGGGSADAAFTLLGVNRLLGLGLDPGSLNDLALQLGSDVPFFLTAGTASVRGRGERVTSLPDGPQLWYVIVQPDATVSTAWAYERLDSIPNRESARATRSMEALIESGDIDRIIGRMTNDFEPAVLPEVPAIGQLFDDLAMARARNVRLCGSGSCVFGVAVSEREAGEIARLIRLKYAQVYVCRSVTREDCFAQFGGSQ